MSETDLTQRVLDAAIRFRRAQRAIDTFWNNTAELNNSGLEVYPFAAEVSESRNEFFMAADALIAAQGAALQPEDDCQTRI
jgi:hypothetical protein